MRSCVPRPRPTRTATALAPDADQRAQTPQPVQPRHHRPANRLLDPNPYSVHADVGLSVDESDDGQDQGEHHRNRGDRDQREDEVDGGPGDHSSAASAKPPHNETTQRGPDQGPEATESERQTKGREIDPEPVSDLGKTGKPTSDDDPVHEEQNGHSQNGPSRAVQLGSSQ